MAGNWLSFGLVLALASLIAVWNWWSEMYDVEGQTFWQVVAGVAGTVLVVGADRLGCCADPGAVFCCGCCAGWVCLFLAGLERYSEW